MSDFSIVVPHRGSAMGLWLTVHSCEEELKRSPFDYNYVIVSNGEKLPLETLAVLDQLSKGGRLLKHLHTDEPLTPPAARQRGAEVADGKYLFFFDNHCLVGKQYFERSVADFEKLGVDYLHSTTCYHASDGYHYSYQLALEYNFWAQASHMVPYCEYKPYECAAGGHGGIAIRSDLWKEVGGYGPEHLLVGYGGEELVFDLKLWRYGHKVHIDPQVMHYHYPGSRAYSRHFTDEYYTNLLVSANVVGGEKWLYKVFDSFTTPGKHLRLRPQKDWYDILIEAHDRSAQYAHEVNVRSERTLDELLIYFRLNQVQT